MATLWRCRGVVVAVCVWIRSAIVRSWCFFERVSGDRTDVDRLILFCDVERPLTNGLLSRFNHWVERTVVRATQTENAPGDKVGLLNRIFGWAYYVRLPGKALKRWNKYVYYAVKFAILMLVVFAVFFMR